MKMPMVVAIVSLAIDLAVPTFAQQKDTVDPQIAQQIRLLAMKFHEAINRNDAAAIAALYTEDAVNVLPGGSFHGRQAIEKGWARVFQSWHPSNDIDKFDRFKAVGNEVRTSGSWSDTVYPTGGAPSNREGIFTWIMVREGDAWKIRRATCRDTTP
jgi:uncharacterized protein (TIGR02246 family)